MIKSPHRVSIHFPVVSNSASIIIACIQFLVKTNYRQLFMYYVKDTHS